jgi:uncharacterized protein DUF2800
MSNGHADASPSSASIWLNCPASVTQARSRVRRASPYTREGTAAHEVAELMIHGFWVPDEIEVEGEIVEVTEEMIEYVQVYVDYVEKRKTGAIAFETETRIELDWLLEPIYGTADAKVVYVEDGKTVLEIIDLKFGKGVPVGAANNPQLRVYGLGAVALLDDPDIGLDINLVRLTIIQPRIGGPAPDSETLRVRELYQWGLDVLEPAVERIAQSDPTEIPGDWCRWCVRAGECRAFADRTTLAAQAAFDPIPEKIVAGLTNDDLAHILDRAELITAWVNLIRAEASQRADKGDVIPGWKMVPKRALRKWTDDDAALHALNEAGVPLREVIKVVSPAAAERALKANRLGLDAIKGLVTKESSGTTLVRDEDLRKGLALDASSAFTAIA